MRPIILFAFLIAGTADFVPDAGPYIALLASFLAAYAFAAAPGLAALTIGYGILGTLVYSPDFVLSDILSGGPNVGPGAGQTPEAAANLVDAVGALATGTVPDAGGAVTELSSLAAALLVTLHLAALAWGLRRKAAAKAAETIDYERSPYE